MKLVGIIWSKWKIIAHKIGVFQSKVLLTLFYFILLLPLGIIFSVFKDPLGIKTGRRSNWIAKTKQSMTLEDLKQQF